MLGRTSAWRRGCDWLQAHQVALIVIALAFVGRLWMAGVNSYWLDEIYSVYAHAVTQGSTKGVIDSMWGIIHPPLYQIALFHWINLFGDSEVATRSLSSVFIMLASLFLYLFARNIYSRNIAVAVLIVFSMMAIPVTYGLETRSYAMVIMWATLSSLAMMRLLRNGSIMLGWRAFLADSYIWLLIGANTAALFTHYYTAFFLVAQGTFLAICLSLRHDLWRAPGAMSRLACIGILPPATLVLVWGGSMVERYRKGGRFASDADSPGFIDALWGSVLQPNLGQGNWLALILGFFALAYLFRSARRILSGRHSAFCAYMTWYALTWGIGSFVVAFVVLKLVGQDAYGLRYFAFTAPALALLLTLGGFELVRLVGLAVRNVTGADPRRTVYPLGGLAGLVLAAAVVLPQGYAGATAKKHDWRQIAQLVAQTINSDGEHRYVVYDTGWRQKIFDYYLAKQGGDLGVAKTVTVREEGRRSFPSRAEQRRIRQHDYVVMVFTHLPYYRYRQTLRRLNRDYEEAYRVLSADGRGYIVYRVQP